VQPGALVSDKIYYVKSPAGVRLPTGLPEKLALPRAELVLATLHNIGRRYAKSGLFASGAAGLKRTSHNGARELLGKPLTG
jgi:hypothetical protein